MKKATTTVNQWAAQKVRELIARCIAAKAAELEQMARDLRGRG